MHRALYPHPTRLQEKQPSDREIRSLGLRGIDGGPDSHPRNTAIHILPDAEVRKRVLLAARLMLFGKGNLPTSLGNPVQIKTCAHFFLEKSFNLCTNTHFDVNLHIYSCFQATEEESLTTGWEP